MCSARLINIFRLKDLIMMAIRGQTYPRGHSFILGGMNIAGEKCGPMTGPNHQDRLFIRKNYRSDFEPLFWASVILFSFHTELVVQLIQ